MGSLCENISNATRTSGTSGTFWEHRYQPETAFLVTEARHVLGVAAEQVPAEPAPIPSPQNHPRGRFLR
jgi:hypothetical protein